MRIKSLEDLKAVLDAEEQALMREMLDHNCWVVEQRWGKDDFRSVAPELHGPFESAAEALVGCERLHAEAIVATRWVALHGAPVTRVVPVYGVERGETA